MVIIFGLISLSMTALFFIQMKKRNIILEQPKQPPQKVFNFLRFFLLHNIEKTNFPFWKFVGI